jgi:ketosteroid isomerase-like protein
MRAGLREFFVAFPDITTTPVGLYSDGDWSIIEWIGTGTWKGPFLDRVPTGRSYTLRGCGFFRVSDGLIQEQRGYWDRATWFGQIGLPIEQA